MTALIQSYRGDFIILDRVIHNGHVIAKFRDIKRVYVGYTNRQVLREFKREIKGVR